MIKKFYKNPDKKDWEALQERPAKESNNVKDIVTEILEAIKKEGDNAIQFYAKKLDQNHTTQFLVTDAEIADATSLVSDDLKKAIQVAKENITAFHQMQLKEEPMMETMPGISCWRKNKAIEKVGLYIPGGTAPLFSTVLMLAIPAQLAGCAEIIICTPPMQSKNNETIENRSVHPAILYTAACCGITKIYKIGGAAAIAALAYGTASIPKVYKIFGPGNQYVTAAKQMVQQEGVAIDMPAGPSEVCILADATANPKFVAADLLSQAEHGTDSQVLLVATPDFDIVTLQKELETQMEDLPRKTQLLQTIQNSIILIFDQLEDAIAFTNGYAAEHLIISCKNEMEIANKISNAGSIFLGNYSPESAGDYASGTNHTLPTNGYAKQYSGVSIDSFVKKITYQKITKEGLNTIAKTVITMAEAEQLQAHANAIKIRQYEF